MFISNGDFLIAFNFLDYFLRHFFLWSDNTSALSLDGVIRIFSKSEVLLFFWITDSSLLSGYFYIFFTVTVCAVSGYLFFRKFLDLSNSSALLGSFLFVMNPAFLGNYSKIGLVLSASVLPLILVLQKKFIAKHDLSSLIGVLLLLNVSLIHPFTFIVNSIVLGFYTIFQYKKITFLTLGKLLGGGIIFILFSLYFILPLLNLGTVSKDALQNQFSHSAEEVDYTELVDVANTGGYTDGFIMAKSKFLDFNFYTESNKIIFYLGSYLLLILIIVLFYQQNRTKKEKKRFLLFSVLYLITVSLAAIGIAELANFVKWAISTLPAGWSLRSPLKWQLYTPLCLAGLLAFSVEGLKKYRRPTIGFIIILIFAINYFTVFDIYKKLLIPKELGQYSSLYTELQNADSLLFVRNTDCIKVTPAIDHSIINQITMSLDASIYSVTDKQLPNIPLTSFSHILICNNSIQPPSSLFNKIQTVGNFSLYYNQNHFNEISVFDDLYQLTEQKNFSLKHDFINTQYGKQPFWFTRYSNLPNHESRYLHNIFENISPSQIQDNKLTVAIPETVMNGKLFESFETSSVSPMNRILESYTYPKDIQFNNIINNGSFENGAWQDSVSDCYAYDLDPVIEMKVVNTQPEGNKVLSLSATRHTACTSQKISIQADMKYLLSFNYQSDGDRQLGYSLRYTNNSSTLAENTQQERLTVDSAAWHTYTTIINTPSEAENVDLFLYTYESDGATKITNQYDNISLIQLPNDLFDYWLTSEPQTDLVEPREITFDLINPTKKLVNIKGATTPFYLAMSESFHPEWQAQFNNEKVNGFLDSWVPFVKPDHIRDEHHFELNGFLNGWYIDTTEYCQNNNLCTKNPDGSYDLELVLEFFPQRWFYLGLLISGTTFVGLIGYLIYDLVRRRRNKVVLTSAQD